MSIRYRYPDALPSDDDDDDWDDDDDLVPIDDFGDDDDEECNCDDCRRAREYGEDTIDRILDGYHGEIEGG